MGQTRSGGLRDGLAVDGGGQVDRHEVAVLDLTLDTLEGSEALTQRQQLLGNRLLGDLDGVDGDGDGGEIGESDLGADVDLGGEDELLAVLELGDVDLRLADDLHVRGRDGLRVAGRQCVVDDLLQHGAAADAGSSSLAGALPGRKPGRRICCASAL